MNVHSSSLDRRSCQSKDGVERASEGISVRETIPLFAVDTAPRILSTNSSLFVLQMVNDEYAALKFD
jgi:hypothetical protein